MLAVVRDVTERKRAENGRPVSRVVEQTSDSIVIMIPRDHHLREPGIQAYPAIPRRR
jgi:hypothetical protein